MKIQSKKSQLEKLRAISQKLKAQELSAKKRQNKAMLPIKKMQLQTKARISELKKPYGKF